MGTAAIQGTLAGTGAGGMAGTIGSVSSQLNSAVSTHNQALSSALGASAPVRISSGAKWMTAASSAPKPGGEGWATLTGGLGGTSGWRTAEAFGGSAEKAWPTSKDAWAHGGLLPN